MKLAIIGLDLGHPKVFAPLFKKRGIEIHSIVAGPSDAVSEFANVNACSHFSSIDELWEVADQIDGLMVSNLTSERPSVGIFLERGVPAYFDKHLGISARAAKSILDSAAKGDAPILSGSVRRFAPAFVAIQEQAKSGNFGKPVTVQCFEPYPPTPGSWQDKKETSGGFIVNYGIHCIDPLVATLGPDFESVYCAGGRYLFDDAESVDTCVITVQFQNGAIGVAELFGAQAPCLTTQPYMRIHATKQSAEAYIDEGLVRSFRGAPIYDEKTYSFCSGNEGTVEAIAGMMRSRQQPVPSAELLAVSQILDMACQSFETKQAVFRT